MKHIARVGKVWQDKRTGKIYGRELELAAGDNLDNYTMIIPKKETPQKETIFTSYGKKEEKKGMFDNGQN